MELRKRLTIDDLREFKERLDSLPRQIPPKEYYFIDDVDERLEKLKKNSRRFIEWYFPNYLTSYSINTELWENMKLGIYVRNGRK